MTVDMLKKAMELPTVRKRMSLRSGMVLDTTIVCTCQGAIPLINNITRKASQ